MNLEIRNSQVPQTSEKELFKGLAKGGRFEHLKVFLSREKIKQKLPMYFLYVGKDSFGKVMLDDVDFDGSQIHLNLEDCTTGFKKIVPIDIDDTEFQFILISWDDVTRK